MLGGNDRRGKRRLSVLGTVVLAGLLALALALLASLATGSARPALAAGGTFSYSDCQHLGSFPADLGGVTSGDSALSLSRTTAPSI